MTPQAANQRLTEDLQRVMRDAEELLKATAGEAGEKVEDVRRRLTRALAAARATCAQREDRTGEAVQAADQVIREHPYESIGAAFGVGLLLGVLVGRR